MSVGSSWDERTPTCSLPLALGAAVLVTGDRTRLGPLRERVDLPLRVRAPRDFLVQRPAG